MNLYQHAKYKAISSFYSGDIFGLKIWESHGPRTFWPIYQVPDFSQKWDLSRIIANKINFPYSPNSGKIIKNFFNNFFDKKIRLCHAEIHVGFWHRDKL